MMARNAVQGVIGNSDNHLERKPVHPARRVTSAVPENRMTPACVNTRGPGQTRGNSHDQ